MQIHFLIGPQISQLRWPLLFICSPCDCTCQIIAIQTAPGSGIGRTQPINSLSVPVPPQLSIFDQWLKGSPSLVFNTSAHCRTKPYHQRQI